MILSVHAAKAAQNRFAARLERLEGPKRREIPDRLAEAAAHVSEDVVLAARWLYANSPLSDWVNYPASLFLSCAAHGVFLRESSPYARDLPEELFLPYVLHSRVNDEELSDCRPAFFRLLADRVRGRTDTEAVIETNYWCAEQMTYRPTDERTISALGAYRSGFGRCGEESAFAVNALRSIGIPARQVYAPRWAHCDDNHAWVEAWCGGGWHYLGACEPEEALDRGWFTGAASRAAVIHSRRFGEGAEEETIAREGAVTYLNQLPRYGAAKRLTAVVRDASGAAAAGARVSFCVLNYASLVPVAVLTTGADGTAGLTCGLGSIHLEARKGAARCERTVFVPDADRVELILTERPPACGRWEDFICAAPRDRAGGAALTESQRARGFVRNADAAAKRERRAAAMFDPARAEAVTGRYGYSRAVYALLERSRGNFDSLLDFLEDARFPPEDKEALLLSLTEKDWRDVDPEILREALALQNGDRGRADYWSAVVCPRVDREPLRRSRRLILDWFSPERKAAFRADPGRIWAYVEAEIRPAPEMEYDRLFTCPAGALTAGSASARSRELLFVSVCRALGIAAKLDPVEGEPVYDGGAGYVPLRPPEDGYGTLVLEKGPEEVWQYAADFSVGRLTEEGYRTLDLSGLSWMGNRLAVPVRAGTYRIITANRLPNGDQYAGRCFLHLAGGASGVLRLRRHQAPPEAMLARYTLEDFTVRDRAGRPVSGRALTAGGPAVLLWLEEGREPTEHLLSEMLERRTDFRDLPAELILLVRGMEALEDARIRAVLAAFERVRVCFDSVPGQREALARRVYADPEKPPLAIVTAGELRAVYASGGYNVGIGDMIVKICRLL